MSNPYKFQPEMAFWSKSVSTNFNSKDLIPVDKRLLSRQDKVVSAGSCFAANLIPYIEKAGLEYVRTEKLPKIFSALGENLGYSNFSAAYGNIYTARQLRQLYERALGIFTPAGKGWKVENCIVDPFRPGLKFPASSEEEFDFLTTSHLSATKKAFEMADVFIFTLGLTEAWLNKNDGAVYPACPGTISGTFDSNVHIFKNFNSQEIVEDLSSFIHLVREVNPKVRFILSVSPVPLVATATKDHVLNSTIYSKSVLRVAADEVSKNIENVTYFPAYEIITGPQAPSNYFESDRRNVSKAGVNEVMKTLLEASELEFLDIEGHAKITNGNSPESEPLFSDLSRDLTNVDCDEVFMELNS